MVRFETLPRSVVTIIVIAMSSISFHGQTAPAASQSDSAGTKSATTKSATIALSISIPKDHIAVGQTPWVLLTVENLGPEDIAFPDDRVYVEGENGEPPTTLRQRQLTNRRRPGEPSLVGGGFEPTIEPGDSFTRKYDLSQLYDLSKPGKYSVYIEVLNAFHSTGWKGGWLRSPTAHFVVQGSSSTPQTGQGRVARPLL